MVLEAVAYRSWWEVRKSPPPPASGPAAGHTSLPPSRAVRHLNRGDLRRQWVGVASRLMAGAAAGPLPGYVADFHQQAAPRDAGKVSRPNTKAPHCCSVRCSPGCTVVLWCSLLAHPLRFVPPLALTHFRVLFPSNHAPSASGARRCLRSAPRPVRRSGCCWAGCSDRAAGRRPWRSQLGRGRLGG